MLFLEAAESLRRKRNVIEELLTLDERKSVKKVAGLPHGN